jgi:hypothetical protein
MKLSQLFSELETILDQHGDLDVFVPDHQTGATSPVFEADVDDNAKTVYLLPK